MSKAPTIRIKDSRNIERAFISTARSNVSAQPEPPERDVAEASDNRIPKWLKMPSVAALGWSALVRRDHITSTDHSWP